MKVRGGVMSARAHVSRFVSILMGKQRLHYSILLDFLCTLAGLLNRSRFSLLDKDLSFLSSLPLSTFLCCSSFHNYRAAQVKECLHMDSHTHMFSHHCIWQGVNMAWQHNKSYAPLIGEFTFNKGRRRPMKALWHGVNALKVYWQTSLPIRSIFAVPLRSPASLVSADTQLFDSLSRLCHLHVGLRLWKSTVQPEHPHTHHGCSSSHKQPLAHWW